ncbi:MULTISPECIES: 2-hydroxyacid dehydrogenase [Pelosinus]|uniref:D-isomer specific 2-hydroxyacid dehydrogenase NAD-binding protein n=1 Tax=Pelosinus fermentans B4 TaxID=1149862 RepID=I9LFW4_9FIRM|nr:MULTISPECIES: D-glycerate dehydrogenase [Pelosinus]EIW19364.1 D-isomer specific 2-hydroxyacid dehydrogenase NAD-binding protein [Pelosinus fermentans B4]EIW24905.1 D-isomer specific 2-hydroxyacid dehydrogenase NAD-binding protein [Pelosinus fermentans A11]
MTKASVYVTRMIPEDNIEELRKHFAVEVNQEDRALSKEELKEKLKGKHAVISLLTDTIDSEVLDAAGPQLKIVANYAVGFNNFDLAAATERNVILTNTPGVLDESTATLTFTLLLSMARRIPEANKFLRDGKWQGWAPMFFIGLDVDKKTLGVAGLGRIGKNVARKAKGFDMKIIYTDVCRNEEFEKQVGATFVDKETLLKESDFLTLHVPLIPETHHYIGEKELKMMKKTAVLINASRGPVVDEIALVKALQEKEIWGAGLDVFEEEPRIAPGLSDLDNVVIVPHIASATMDTRLKMGAIAVDNIIKVLKGQMPVTCVNPEVLKK